MFLLYLRIDLKITLIRILCQLRARKEPCFVNDCKPEDFLGKGNTQVFVRLVAKNAVI